MEIKWSVIKKLLLSGIGICGLCCVLPMIGVSVFAGSLAFMAIWLDKIGLGLILITGLIFIYRYYKKRKVKACSTDCNCQASNMN